MTAELMTKFQNYQQDVIEDIHLCFQKMNCQPILFIGSGLSRRYINAPNWEMLLKDLGKKCPFTNKPFAFYKQKFVDLIDIGTEFSKQYATWAWDDQANFPPELFEDGITEDMYFKYSAAKVFEEITPENLDNVPPEYASELKSLQAIRPHAIITTNYDGLLEIIFPEYTPIIGERVLYSEATSIGEIFKIHGSYTDFKSIVINRDDYNIFQKKKKYLSAKLLTCFAEHPLLFVGYAANDSNIKAILSDIDELLCPNKNDVVSNLYFLEWNKDSESYNSFPREKLIQLDDDRDIRVKYIIADSFEWVFNAFCVNEALERVHPKLLRALLARTYQLIRSDIPKNKVEVDYHSLAAALEERDSSKIFGVTSVVNPESFNINFPYTLTDVGKQLGFNGWHGANKLIEEVKSATGKDIKASDNNYHVKVYSSKNGSLGKYSQELILLLRKVLKKEPYELNL